MRFTITADHGRYSWTIPVPIFEVKKNGFQTLTIPVSGNFNIEIAAPAQRLKDNRAFSPGIRAVGTFLLKKGQKITVLLGQMETGPNCLSDIRRDEHATGVRRKFVPGRIGRPRPEEILSRSKFCFLDLMVGTGVPELLSRLEFRGACPSRGASLCVMEGEHGPEPLVAVGSEGNFSTDSYSKFGYYLGYFGYCKIQRQEDQKL